MYARARERYLYEQRYVESSYDPGYNRVILNRRDHFSQWRVTGINEVVAQATGHADTRSARRAMGRMTFDALVAAYALEHRDSVFQLTAISDAAGKAIVDARDASRTLRDVVLCVERTDFDDVYVLNGRQIYFYSSKVREIDGEHVPGKPLTNLWVDIPWNGIANEGGVEFKNGKKPEKLIRRCIEISTNPGDLVLDSFAGSGTTGAVAHKMGRRWIMVEFGEHCHTHIIPRLQKVIDGQDPGGITEAVGWKGGGGFRYYRLAPSLLERDRWGNWVVSREYDAVTLAQALCKLQGFSYAPSELHWWQHGHASERDFLYVTTQTLSAAQLQALAEEVSPQRSLVVLCAAWHGVSAAQAAERWPNLTLKKIPKAVLASCEWGRDDYSLNVANLPMAQPDEPASGAAPSARAASRARTLAAQGQGGLFDGKSA
jgi:adenine-specific DNA-methyltransferase